MNNPYPLSKGSLPIPVHPIRPLNNADLADSLFLAFMLPLKGFMGGYIRDTEGYLGFRANGWGFMDRYMFTGKKLAYIGSIEGYQHRVKEGYLG